MPNVAVVGAFLFTVGVLSRQLIPVYRSGVGILIGFLGALNLGFADAGGDPLAIGALMEMTQHWTAAEQNTRLIGFPADLLWNRVIWLAVAAAVLALLHYSFRSAHADGGRRSRRERITVAPDSAPAVPVVVPTALRAFGFRTTVRQTLAIARNSLLEVVGSRWFVVVLFACVGPPLLWRWNAADSVFDTSTWPVTLLVAEVVLSGRAEILFYLLVYNSRPSWAYSDMNGFGPYIEQFVWFKLYWAAWALLLAVVACVLWVRGRESALRSRLKPARARFTGPVLRTAGVATVLIIGLGGFIFYNTNVLNEYTTEDEQGIAQAEYERRYGRFEDSPQPTIESAALRLEIYPDEPAVELRGSYRLVNLTDAPHEGVARVLHRAVRP